MSNTTVTVYHSSRVTGGHKTCDVPPENTDTVRVLERDCRQEDQHHNSHKLVLSSYQVLASLNFPKPTLCPEKDTTDPERETKKGSEGSKPPIKRSKRIAHSLIDSANHLLEAGKKHSTRQTRRTVFDAARIVDMSEGSNERNQSRTKRRAHSVKHHSNSVPQQPSYRWTQNM